MRFLGKNIVLFAILLFSQGILATADESCYMLSNDGKNWPPIPEMMCIKKKIDNLVQIDLITGPATKAIHIASFHYERVPSIPEIKSYNVPINSIFKSLRIVVEGAMIPHEGGVAPDIGLCKIGPKIFYCYMMRRTP